LYFSQLDRRCLSPWHDFPWSFSWGSSRCGIWRAILAFTFIAAMAWLFNAALGLYKTIRGKDEYDHTTTRT
jgi:hypothetical protein